MHCHTTLHAEISGSGKGAWRRGVDETVISPANCWFLERTHSISRETRLKCSMLRKRAFVEIGEISGHFVPGLTFPIFTAKTVQKWPEKNHFQSHTIIGGPNLSYLRDDSKLDVAYILHLF